MIEESRRKGPHEEEDDRTQEAIASEQTLSAEQQVLREAVLVVIEDRYPGEEDTSDPMQFQVDAAIRSWLLGGTRVAFPLLEILIQRYPFDAHPEYILGCLLGRENNLAAIAHLERAIQLNPWKYRRCAVEVRNLLVRLGQNDEAREYWDNVRRRHYPILVRKPN